MSSTLADHLWQSTLLALGAAMLAVMCRRNHASVRYWVWWSASVKFLIPFALLTSIAGRIDRVPDVQSGALSAISSTLDRVSEPFSETGISVMSSPVHSSRRWLAPLLFAAWASGFIAIVIIRVRAWRRLAAVVRAAALRRLTGIELPPDIQLRAAPGGFEPGIVGWWRPVLLVPADIEEYVTRRQLEAIVEHEVWHVRRRDNFTAAVHMAVEALFWFHPLVWWIGARLTGERERACDEHVLRTFGEPRTYAEAILNVCRRYVESPLVCVPGVTGSELRVRLEAIMCNQIGQSVDLRRKVALGAAIAVAVSVPVATGLLHDKPLSAQAPAAITFEVASIKPNPKGRTDGTSTELLPGGRYIATNMPLRLLIGQTYRITSLRLIGGPGWIESEHFDINAKAAVELFPAAGQRPLESALKALLADRFKLVVHTETRQLPIYALVKARAGDSLGPNLSRSSTDDCDALLAAARGRGGPPPPPPPGRDALPCSARTFPGQVTADSQTMAYLAALVSSDVNRTVIDRTGLTGRFNFRLTWAPDRLSQTLAADPQPLPSIDANDASIFTALQEQLGLKLEATTGPVDVLVIDSVERPTPD